MRYELKAYSIYELGQRDNQEDSLFPSHGSISDSDRLFVLCDGMGGHSSGEVASSTVCEALSQAILESNPDIEGPFSDDEFREALAKAYDALDAKDNGAAKKMGTTMTLLKFHSEGCTIAHIGDSRVYHVRPGEDWVQTRILFQTVDHSLVNDLVKIGEMTPEEAKTSKQKNIITRAMQPCMERRSRADLYHTCDIQPGDFFMLCSDGILEQMEDQHIQHIFSDKTGSDLEKIELITNSTSQNRDNHTAIVVHITDVIDPIVPNCPTQKLEDEDETTQHPAFESNNGHIDSTYRRLVGSTIWLLLLIGCFFIFRSLPWESDNKERPAVEKPSIEPTSEESSNMPHNGEGANTPTTTPQPTQHPADSTSVEQLANAIRLSEEAQGTATVNNESKELIDNVGQVVDEIDAIKKEEENKDKEDKEDK